MDEISIEYFSNTNHLFKAFLGDVAMVKHSYGDAWSGLSPKQQSRLIDHFYKVSEDNSGNGGSVEDGDEDGDEYYNILKIESGEKVVTDFENDANGWTWVDEHSAPFSWKSKSQQDLRFKDLFNENSTKNINNNHNNNNNNNNINSNITTNTNTINNLNKGSFNYKNNNNNKNEGGDILNSSTNEIEKMFKKFGLNSNDKSEDDLNIATDHISVPDHKEALDQYSHPTLDELSDTREIVEVSIEEGFKAVKMGDILENNKDCCDDNVLANVNNINYVNNINGNNNVNNENSNNVNNNINSKVNNDNVIHYNTTNNIIFVKEEDDNECKLKVGWIRGSVKDTIDLGHYAGESSSDKNNDDDNNNNTCSNTVNNNKTTNNMNPSSQEVAEEGGVISLQPIQEILPVKKTGFDFLDNW